MTITNPEFKVYKLNSIGIEQANAIAEEFDLLLVRLGAYCQAGRELSIVKTKLEEACFFAKKAMASHPAHQVNES
jgi:hypothetical protein